VRRASRASPKRTGFATIEPASLLESNICSILTPPKITHLSRPAWLPWARFVRARGIASRVIPIDGPERGTGNGRMCTSRAGGPGRRRLAQSARFCRPPASPGKRRPNSRAGGGLRRGRTSPDLKVELGPQTTPAWRRSATLFRLRVGSPCADPPRGLSRDSAHSCSLRRRRVLITKLESSGSHRDPVDPVAVVGVSHSGDRDRSLVR